MFLLPTLSRTCSLGIFIVYLLTFRHVTASFPERYLPYNNNDVYR